MQTTQTTAEQIVDIYCAAYAARAAARKARKADKAAAQAIAAAHNAMLCVAMASAHRYGDDLVFTDGSVVSVSIDSDGDVNGMSL